MQRWKVRAAVWRDAIHTTQIPSAAGIVNVVKYRVTCGARHVNANHATEPLFLGGQAMV